MPATAGWASVLEPAGIKIAYAPVGIVVALIFVGLPFAVRTVQPVLEALHARTRGGRRLARCLALHHAAPRGAAAAAAGDADRLRLAFARGVGEYGSVIFIAGNLPYVSEIAPLLIVIKLEEFDYHGATVIAMLMLAMSFAILFVVNKLQRRLARGQAV